MLVVALAVDQAQKIPTIGVHTRRVDLRASQLAGFLARGAANQVGEPLDGMLYRDHVRCYTACCTL